MSARRWHLPAVTRSLSAKRWMRLRLGLWRPMAGWPVWWRP